MINSLSIDSSLDYSLVASEGRINVVCKMLLPCCYQVIPNSMEIMKGYGWKCTCIIHQPYFCTSHPASGRIVIGVITTLRMSCHRNWYCLYTVS